MRRDGEGLLGRDLWLAPVEPRAHVGEEVGDRGAAWKLSTLYVVCLSLARSEFVSRRKKRVSLMRRCHFSGIRTCLAEGPYCAAVGSRCCSETTESSSMRIGGTVWFAASPESGSRWSGTLPVARRSARLPASSRFSSSAIAARAALATAASFCCGPLGRVCGLQHRSASSSQRDVWSCFWRDGSACSATWGGRRERSWLRRSFTEFSLRRRLETA